tara:strand:+ start:3347 stop:4681 length:1335 start_codon:yes stop_codon:yes gene_type:complete
MAVPKLAPISTTSKVVLHSTGSSVGGSSTAALSNAPSDSAAQASNYPFGMYVSLDSGLYSTTFISGAADQVSYVYKKLGGDVLDIELSVANVYSSYEEAVLEYSYLVNLHQAKSILPSVLGNTTGTFDHHGHLLAGPLSSSLTPDSGERSRVGLKYPRFKFTYTKRIADGMSEEIGVGGLQTEYSASFSTENLVQDYDLQKIVKAQDEFASSVGNKKITIKKVFFKTPHAMWRFYGYYGGLNTVGNLSTYGMFADDSTFEVIPPWQNKLQAMAYEDAIWTRNSHYSYELKNNKLRIYPTPTDVTPGKIWIRFTIQADAWTEEDNKDVGVDGINNLNTLPFENIPYKNINSIGKQWIRRFSLALCKEMLGQIRGKFTTIPIPGESVTLNHTELLSQAKEEQEKLREELKTILDELTYNKLAEIESQAAGHAVETTKNIPAGVFIG